MNKVFLVGQFVKDPAEAKSVNGDRCVRFCLMTKEFVTNRAGKVLVKEDFHYFYVWGVLADFVLRHFRDRRLAIVEGRIAYREERGVEGQIRLAQYIKVSKVTPVTPADRPTPSQSQSRPEPKPKVRTGDGGDYAYGEVPDRDYSEEVPHG